MSDPRRPHRAALALLLACVALLLAFAPPTLSPLSRPPSLAAAAGPAMTGLHVSGNQLLNGSGQAVRLRGVNRAGLEYACIQGWGFFDGPSDAASVAAIAAWGVNVVRIPVNEDCWLNINGVPAEYGGANYKAALANFIGLINAAGMAAIIDLHWAAPGGTPATEQIPMADRSHAPTFWAQVAAAYKGNSAVLFDLFNEPYPDDNTDSVAAWKCWRDGGTCPGVGYQAAGMQEMVTAVRNAGATNVIMAGGVTYSAHLSRWLEYKPTDPTGNLMAAWHVYAGSQCNDQECWDDEAAPVAAQVPLVAGEIGQNDCAHDFIDELMDWHDAHGAGYLGWTWNVEDCADAPALISDYDGTPTNFGIGLKNRLAGQGGTSPSPSPSPSSSPSTGPCGTRFGDVPAADPACVAIEALAARGVINGCDSSASPPLFCPNDPTLRHQMAALIVRAIPDWANETGLPNFTDNTDDTELMTRVGTLQRHNVVRGYQGEVCTGQGKQPPCYGPLDTVKYGQVLLFISRAMVAKGYWSLQPDDRTIFPDQNGAAGADPNTDQQTLDHRMVVTYVHYVGNPPDVADVHAPFLRAGVAAGGWGDDSTRAWFARAFWPAIRDH